MNCNFCLFFDLFIPKTYVIESFRWGIIPLDFVGFFLGFLNLKNGINYIKYKFSHRFGKVWSKLTKKQ
jgi:hypothetical protein